ncbi:tyrosine-type recombinase/integrase [Pseudoalteromonas obscura]|uniref:Site-specific integrase n=1 Tax=Pseudoalteromonas obscura TaxID=3048491 RepID=A0ABT7ESA1_9GAMM|nr:site-specific integrase [Pseudoalteromonas sp. P94(2023)]MDK2597937.1 site-specific integrase [Pseudoalteromonas sp. P94(2023)]
MKFTDKQIQSLKPKDKRYILTETTSGYGEGRLQVRVQTTGAKSWRVQYHFDDKRKTISIGTYPNVDLKSARAKHAKITELLLDGIDPQADKVKKQKIKEAIEAERTFLQMLDDFDDFIAQNWAESTIRRTRLLIARNITPFIPEELAPHQFTIDDAREIIYRVYNRGAKEQAHLTRATLMSLLKFAIDFDNSPEQYKKPDIYKIKINFIRDINFETPKNVGERWLNEQEIYKIWHAEDLPRNTHLYLKLAIALAGQRVFEVYHSIEPEYDFDEMIFTIPVNRVKVRSRGEHLVPIEPLTESILKELLLQRGKHKQLFPHRDHEDEFAHISTLRMAILRWCDRHKVPRFTPRDIRRTCKTLMGKAGIKPDHKDYLQQHHKSDVSSTHYDRYNYMNEKRRAMKKWHRFLAKTIGVK